MTAREDVEQDIFDEISGERARQIILWGTQNHSPCEWLAILAEEFGEVSKEVNEMHFGKYGQIIESARTNLREELIQVAAVAVAFVECLDRDNK
jgi:NTP pyrophosphatase (non-canonical NTP hydrolase)